MSAGSAPTVLTRSGSSPGGTISRLCQAEAGRLDIVLLVVPEDSQRQRREVEARDREWYGDLSWAPGLHEAPCGGMAYLMGWGAA